MDKEQKLVTPVGALLTSGGGGGRAETTLLKCFSSPVAASGLTARYGFGERTQSLLEGTKELGNSGFLRLSP